MSVRFSTLWTIWIGWFLGDVGCFWLYGRPPDYATDYAIAFFIAIVWVFERWWPAAITRFVARLLGLDITG